MASSAARRFGARCDLVDALAQAGWARGPLLAGHAALHRAAARRRPSP